MKIVILVPEAHGHVNPTLPLAAELAARGHEVVYFLPESFAAVVGANGATRRPVNSVFAFPTDCAGPPIGLRRMEESSIEQQAGMTEFMQGLRLKMSTELPELRQRIEAERADCVVYDAYGLWMLEVARALSGPKVAFFPTFAIPDGASAMELLSIAGRQALPPAIMGAPSSPGPLALFREPFQAEALNVVALPRSFHPNSAAFDDRYLFVGPSIRGEGSIGDFPLEQLDGKRVALVSLGTGAVDPAFFDACFEAFAGSDWLVAAATGRTDPATLRPLPPNVIGRPHLPQLAVLRRSSVFVTHGGMNSTMEGLWYGVPLVVVPQHADQHLVADRISTLDLGRTLDPDGLTGQAVRTAVDAVIADARIAANVAALQAEMRTDGGAHRAAEAVERYAATVGSSSGLETALNSRI